MTEPLTKEEVRSIAEQVAQQIAQTAAEQAASQVAQQTQQTVGQTVSDAISKLLQSQTTTAGMTTTQERMGDIGGTERLEKESMDNAGMLFMNEKRTYDEFQQESLESIRRNRSYIDKVLSDAQQHDNQRQDIANQALQNAVESANMVSKQNIRAFENSTETANFTGKQASRHSDIAIDRQWNVDEQGYTAADILKAISGDTNVQKALYDMLAKVVGDTVTNSKQPSGASVTT